MKFSRPPHILLPLYLKLSKFVIRSDKIVWIGPRLAQHKCVLRLEHGFIGVSHAATPIAPTTRPSKHLGIPQHGTDTAAGREAQEQALEAKLLGLRAAMANGDTPLQARAWLWRTVAVPRLAWLLGSCRAAELPSRE